MIETDRPASEGPRDWIADSVHISTEVDAVLIPVCVGCARPVVRTSRIVVTAVDHINQHAHH